MTEVNRHVCVSKSELVPEIDFGYNLDTFTPGETNDCLPHAAIRTNQCHTEVSHCSRFSLR
jgi:hypothetical protein